MAPSENAAQVVFARHLTSSSAQFTIPLRSARVHWAVKIMASGELGLKTAFYVYPCILFVSLLGVQSFQFWRRRRDATAGASATIDKQDADAIRRFYARLLWLLQLVLSILILASVIIAVREAVAELHDASGKVSFSFSAYLVRAHLIALHGASLADVHLRLHMSEFCSTSWPVCCQILKGHGRLVRRTASPG